MEDFSKLAGDLHPLDFDANHFPPMEDVFAAQGQMDAPVMSAPGTSVQGEMLGDAIGNAGRKKKKKHKSGDDGDKSDMLDEDEMVDAAIPMLPENQGIDELLFPTSLPPAGGTLVGGQYLLNNALLDQILAEKKMQLMQSPEVIEFIKKQMARK